MTVLPNWIIAGAPKAGTSSLFRWLVDHPDVSGPSEKETYYFVDPGTHMFAPGRNFHHGGVAGYSNLFESCDPSAKAVIEFTPAYPYSETALRELPALRSVPQFIFILREPVAQIRSLFSYFQQNWNWIPRDMTFAKFVAAVEAGEDRFNGNELAANALRNAWYPEHLARWRSAVGPGRMMVLLFEDLVEDPLMAMRRVSERLGIDASFYEGYSFEAENQTYFARNGALQDLNVVIRGRTPAGSSLQCPSKGCTGPSTRRSRRPKRVTSRWKLAWLLDTATCFRSSKRTSVSFSRARSEDWNIPIRKPSRVWSPTKISHSRAPAFQAGWPRSERLATISPKARPSLNRVALLNDHGWVNGGQAKVAIETGDKAETRGHRRDVHCRHGAGGRTANRERCRMPRGWRPRHSLRSEPPTRSVGWYLECARSSSGPRLRRRVRCELDRYPCSWLGEGALAEHWTHSHRLQGGPCYTLHEYFLACPNGGFFHYGSQEICHKRALSLACLTSRCDVRNDLHKVWRAARQVVLKTAGRMPSALREIIYLSPQQRAIMTPYIPLARAGIIFQIQSVNGPRRAFRPSRTNSSFSLGGCLPRKVRRLPPALRGSPEYASPFAVTGRAAIWFNGPIPTQSWPVGSKVRI